MKIKVGDVAPGFKALDQSGKMQTLSEYVGRWVLLYFYPKDDTPGCTKQACALRDDFPAFEKLNVSVLGVSADGVKSHKKFEERYQLPFSLLADEDKSIITAYDVWGEKKMMGRTYMGIRRTSFLIDPAGKIAAIFENVKPDMHAEEVLAFLRLGK